MSAANELDRDASSNSPLVEVDTEIVEKHAGELYATLPRFGPQGGARGAAAQNDADLDIVSDRGTPVSHNAADHRGLEKESLQRRAMTADPDADQEPDEQPQHLATSAIGAPSAAGAADTGAAAGADDLNAEHAGTGEDLSFTLEHRNAQAPILTVRDIDPSLAAAAEVSVGGSESPSASSLSDPQNLFVRNVPLWVGDRELRVAFEKFGRVVSASIMRHLASGDSKGHGFVMMSNGTEAQAAINEGVSFPTFDPATNAPASTTSGDVPSDAPRGSGDGAGGDAHDGATTGAATEETPTQSRPTPVTHVVILKARHTGANAVIADRRRVFISNVPQDLPVAQLRDFFETKFGGVVDCIYQTSRVCPPGTCIAFVEFAEAQKAQDAIAEVHGTRPFGEKWPPMLLKISETKSMRHQRHCKRELSLTQQPGNGSNLSSTSRPQSRTGSMSQSMGSFGGGGGGGGAGSLSSGRSGPTIVTMSPFGQPQIHQLAPAQPFHHAVGGRPMQIPAVATTHPGFAMGPAGVVRVAAPGGFYQAGPQQAAAYPTFQQVSIAAPSVGATVVANRGPGGPIVTVAHAPHQAFVQQQQQQQLHQQHVQQHQQHQQHQPQQAQSSFVHAAPPQGFIFAHQLAQVPQQQQQQQHQQQHHAASIAVGHTHQQQQQRPVAYQTQGLQSSAPQHGQQVQAHGHHNHHPNAPPQQQPSQQQQQSAMAAPTSHVSGVNVNAVQGPGGMWIQAPMYFGGSAGGEAAGAQPSAQQAMYYVMQPQQQQQQQQPQHINHPTTAPPPQLPQTSHQQQQLQQQQQQHVFVQQHPQQQQQQSGGVVHHVHHRSHHHHQQQHHAPQHQHALNVVVHGPGGQQQPPQQLPVHPHHQGWTHQ